MVPSTQYPEYGLKGDADFRWADSPGQDILPIWRGRVEGRSPWVPGLGQAFSAS